MIFASLRSLFASLEHSTISWQSAGNAKKATQRERRLSLGCRGIRWGLVLAEEGENLGGDVFGGEAELFIQNLVGSGCTEVVQTEYLAVDTNNAAER
jgi:hypothetical protein